MYMSARIKLTIRLNICSHGTLDINNCRQAITRTPARDDTSSCGKCARVSWVLQAPPITTDSSPSTTSNLAAVTVTVKNQLLLECCEFNVGKSSVVFMSWMVSRLCFSRPRPFPVLHSLPFSSFFFLSLGWSGADKRDAISHLAWRSHH